MPPLFHFPADLPTTFSPPVVANLFLLFLTREWVFFSAFSIFGIEHTNARRHINFIPLIGGEMMNEMSADKVATARSENSAIGINKKSERHLDDDQGLYGTHHTCSSWTASNLHKAIIYGFKYPTNGCKRARLSFRVQHCWMKATGQFLQFEKQKEVVHGRGWTRGAELWSLRLRWDEWMRDWMRDKWRRWKSGWASN